MNLDRSTSSEGDPQLGKFVLSRQVNLNTPGLSQALLTICSMSVLSVCEPSIEGKILQQLTYSIVLNNDQQFVLSL